MLRTAPVPDFEEIMEKGKPTGIKRQDVETMAYVTFEGERGQIISYDFTSSPEILVLGFGGPRDLVLYGDFDGDEFVEVDREYRG